MLRSPGPRLKGIRDSQGPLKPQKPFNIDPYDQPYQPEQYVETYRPTSRPIARQVVYQQPIRMAQPQYTEQHQEIPTSYYDEQHTLAAQQSYQIHQDPTSQYYQQQSQQTTSESVIYLDNMAGTSQQRFVPTYRPIQYKRLVPAGNMVQPQQFRYGDVLQGRSGLREALAF